MQYAKNGSERSRTVTTHWLRDVRWLLPCVVLLLVSACSVPNVPGEALSRSIVPQAAPLPATPLLATAASECVASEAAASVASSVSSTVTELDAAADEEALRWEVHEIVLTAETEFENPYLDVSVTATFAGPDGEQKVVQGFWNGGSEFRVRFTPTTVGTWTYTIESTPADAGLSASGTLTVVESEARGFVRRDPSHPYSFVYDNGERYFMMGQTYYDLVRTACAEGGDKPAWQVAVDNSKAYGINKIRMLVHPLNFGLEHRHPGFHPPVSPFLEDDHDRLDLAYWKQLDAVVMYLAEQGMTADLILFEPYTFSAFGSPAQDERYVRYILARYAAFPNVIWCLVNEWEKASKRRAYWDGIGDLVRAEDPWMEQGDALRPISIHNQTGGAKGGKFQFFESAWPVHAIIQYGVRNQQFEFGDQWGSYSIRQNYGRDMPVVNDEYGYIGEEPPQQPLELTREQHRSVIWSIVTSGGYGSAGDSRILNDGPEGEPGRVIVTSLWHDAEEYQDIKHLVDFWTTRDIPYWRMTPVDSIAAGERVYVLAEEGVEYVVYAATGGTVELTLPDGEYAVTQFDPRTGTASPGPEVGGGTVSIELPDAEDWVLHLRRM